MLRTALLWLLMLHCVPLLAEDAQIARRLADQQVSGTPVIRAPRSGQPYLPDDPRAAQRFAAASTFKIPNSLIALQLGVVYGPNPPLKWDGTRYSIAN